MGVKTERGMRAGERKTGEKDGGILGRKEGVETPLEDKGNTNKVQPIKYLIN